MKKRKLIVFTNRNSIKTFSPKKGNVPMEFENIERLEKAGVMALREKELIEKYDALHDELFLVSDVIQPSQFKKFYERLPSEDCDLYILFHKNQRGIEFSPNKMFEQNGIKIDYKIKEGMHIVEHQTYQYFARYWSNPKMGADGLIKLIWKEEADDWLNVYSKFIRSLIGNTCDQQSKQLLDKNIEGFALEFERYEKVEGSPFSDEPKKQAFLTFSNWLREKIQEK
jgi:hypothetical protein